MGYSIDAGWRDVRRRDVGFNDRTWLDFNGRPHTEALRVTERFRRMNFGHMVGITFDDPKAT
jgi:hypothetical protein